VNAPNVAVPQLLHVSKKSPKSTLVGGVLVLLAFGVNVSSDEVPPLLSSTKPPPVIVPPEVLTNAVPALFVFHVIVLALALAAIMKIATAVIAAA